MTKADRKAIITSLGLQLLNTTDDRELTQISDKLHDQIAPHNFPEKEFDKSLFPILENLSRDIVGYNEVSEKYFNLRVDINSHIDRILTLIDTAKDDL